jgi:hypothetical protein
MKSKEFIDYIMFGSPLPEEDEMIVEGYVNLQNSNITNLPDNLTILGYLSLNWNKIKKLPQGLKIKGSLFLLGTEIFELPDDLQVLAEIVTDKKLKYVPVHLQKKVRIENHEKK